MPEGKTGLRRKGLRRAGMVKRYYSLYGRLLSKRNLYQAFLKVKSAKGAPGIDGQSIKDFTEGIRENITKLETELRDKSYRPKPVKRVEIPKPDGGIRKLGIPAVRDRVVQQAVLDILQPIFDGDFHPSSYGYRPGRSCHQAIGKATMFIREYGMEWVVDMDLSKCFDTLDHEIILQSFRKRIADGSILNLLKMFLKSGVISGEGFEASEVGSPQGGVISPLVANVYLDAFDQFMKDRRHRIVRYADDILIFTCSKSAALNVQAQATRYLEKELKLTVNQEKTHIVQSSDGVAFLGIMIHTGFTVIQKKKLKSFKERIKKMTRRNSPINIPMLIEELNPLCRGFANYYRIADCKNVYKSLMGWIRRRLRAKQMALWKTPGRLHRRLRQLGHKGSFSSIRMNSWRNASCILAHLAMPNTFFDECGLFNFETVQTGISVSVY